MDIAIHGDTLEAFVTAVTLADAGHSIKLVHNTVHENDQFLGSEPGLIGALKRAQSIGTLHLLESSDGLYCELHWLFFKGESKCGFFSYVDKLLDSQPVSNLIVSTNFGIGSFQEIKERYQKSKNNFALATIPPFLREGSAISDFTKPDLMLIGAESAGLISLISRALDSILQNAKKVMIVSGTEAEFVKTSICSFLATRLSLINEISALAEEMNVDMSTVIDGISADKRVGESYLQPGCGYGGQTLPMEVNNLFQKLSKSTAGSTMLRAVVETNEKQKDVLFRKFWQYYKSNITGLVVGIWGASFKPNSSSTMNSPVHELLLALSANNCKIKLYDPVICENTKRKFNKVENLEVVSSKEQAINQVDALFILTAWNEFKNADLFSFKELMKRPLVFDGRNIFEPEELRQVGVEYYAIGRGQIR